MAVGYFSRMRVDGVPLALRPAFHAYGYGLGAALESVIATIRHTCRIERRRAGPRVGPRIDCFWHEHLPAYIASYLPPAPGEHHIWMNHPIWYMRAVHVLLAWNGVSKLALGSSGHDGQAALAEVVGYLRAGRSTAVAVDGPAGPPHVLRRGALDMALESGLPLVAIRFTYGRVVRAPSWDRKCFPLPFSRVAVSESAPLHVTRENYEEQRLALSRLL